MQLLPRFALPHFVASLFASAGISTIGMTFPGSAAAGPFSDPGYSPAAMTSWATEVDDFARGPMDIAFPAFGLASFGVVQNALGEATSDTFLVFSLGDGGWISLYFEAGIGDGSGDDFAVFENGFFFRGGFFGEFAFVEVSTDGVEFARFPSESLQDFPVTGGGLVDPTDFNNLAGDQPLGLGTGFDLAELFTDPLVLNGTLDLSNVRYVRIVDVVGDGSTVDSLGRPVYDPYPTLFETGGFDLDAVGVLHEAPEPGLIISLAIGGLALVFRVRRRSS